MSNGVQENEHHLYPSIHVTCPSSSASRSMEQHDDITSADIGGAKVKMPVTQLGRVMRAENRIKRYQDQEGGYSMEDMKDAVQKMSDELSKLKTECQLVTATVEQCEAKEEWIRKNVGRKETFLAEVIKGMREGNKSVRDGNASVRASSTSSKRSAARKAALALEQEQLKRRQQLQEQQERANIQEEVQALQEEQRRAVERLTRKREQELQLQLQKERDELECRIEEAKFMSNAGSEAGELHSVFDVGVDRTEPMPQMQPAGRGRVTHLGVSHVPAALEEPPMMSQATERLLQQALLPPTKLQAFEGDYTQFNLFLKNFETRVEAVTHDASHRLQLLLQHLKGEPHTLICAHQLDPDAVEAYAKAKTKLMKEYGHPVRQTIAFRAQLLNWPTIKRESVGDLRKFRMQLELCLQVKESGVGLNELDAPSTLLQLVRKLPEKVQETWCRKVCNLEIKERREANFSDFVNFVRVQSDVANHPVYGRGVGKLESNQGSVRGDKGIKTAATKTSSEAATMCVAAAAPPQNDVPAVVAATSNQPNNRCQAAEALPPDVSKPPCLLCSGDHRTIECQEEKQMSIQDRRLKLKGLCFGCLKPGHMARRCKQRASCSICQGKHPTLLHTETTQNKSGTDVTAGSPSDADATSSTAVKTTCASSSVDKKGAVIVATLPVKVWVASRHCHVVARALVDPASTATFITGNLARKLGVQGSTTQVELATMHNTQGATVPVQVVQGLRVSDLDDNARVTLPPVYVVPSLPFEDNPCPDVADYEHLRSIPLVTIDAPVELLLGMDVPAAIKPLETVPGDDDEPYAQRTKLGWYVNGPMKTKPKSSVKIFANAIHATDLQAKLEAMYYQDFGGAFNFVDKGLSQDDRLWLEQVRNSIRRTQEGQYMVHLPFRSLEAKELLQDNRGQALRQLAVLERKFRRNAQFHADYTQFIQKMEDGGYVERVDDSKASDAGRYIPHHGVYHPRKRKIRVVFNCASPYAGVSLNDCLLPGPDLINSLLGVLIRFRQEPVAFMADIESMFYRVFVPEADRDHLRYLWWPGGAVDPANVKTYGLKVHLFGAASSPSVANYALRQAAKEAAEQGLASKDARESVMKNFYVDDCLKSVSNEEEALKLAQELIRMCQYGGFRLTKFVSTSMRLLRSLPKTELAKELVDVDLGGKENPLHGIQERALGVMWCIKDDVFVFKIELPEKTTTTKREMLSTLSAVYDPLGFAAPVVITARVLFRNATQNRTLGWDDLMESKEWMQWVEGLKELERVRIPRCFKQGIEEPSSEWELHVFCDASTEAYAAVAYLVAKAKSVKQQRQDTQKPSRPAFVLGKARVSPPKVVTVPRLELTAAKLATEIATIVEQELQYRLVRRIFWTDSQTVIKYLRNTKRRFHTFVANRVSTILNTTKIEEWRYVPTKLNPADEATRGTSARQLNDSAWLTGPAYLQEPEEQWPQETEVNEVLETDPEVKRSPVVVRATEQESPFIEQMAQRYSSWHRFVKAVAVLKKFVVYVVSHKRSLQRKISISDMKAAERDAIASLQRCTWIKERQQLLKGECIQRASSLYKLSPALEDNSKPRSVIVMQARTGTALPIIPKSWMAQLVVEEAHRIRAHMGRQATMAEVQRRFWVVGLGQLTRTVVRQCPSCQHRHARPHSAEMAPLPDFRLGSDRAFRTAGIDYFGPFQVKEEDGRRSKAYGVIFTCPSTRAVHLEASDSLSTSSFLNTLRRFVCRRGAVECLVSDNGTNFEGAEKELRKEFNKLKQKSTEIEETLRAKRIEWKFNAPGASHHGGFWERLIQTVRRCLNALVSQPLTPDALSTALCEAESVLNNRPLTSVSEDVRDMEALTPNHILLGQAGPAPPPGVFRQRTAEVSARRQWKQVQARVQSFWKRWIRDYKVLLHQRGKWHEHRRQLELNDVVLVLDPLEMRQYWQLGRIVATHCSYDGQVRTCDVRTNKGVITRPITKICLLETASEKTK